MGAENEPLEQSTERESAVPTEGDVVAGKYRVERVLGQGGMGVVVAARHTSLRQHVAVKFLLPKAMKLPGAAERFLREARAVVAIKSEHVARVLDIGELEGGEPYMVMEYLTGSDFGQMLRARGPLPPKEAVDYVLQACEALAEAHALGIVHRDLKPGNLFLTTRADGSALVKVLDFGLSKATKSDDDGAPEHSLTAPDMIVGSPHYMSPEQLKSLKQVDTRTDVWALGVILYQLLSGKRPFEAESLVATCVKIAGDAPTPLRERKPDASPELEAVILRCLEKDMQKRVQSVAELARLLSPFGSERAPISVERIVRVLEGDQAVSVKLSAQDILAQDPTAAASAWGKTSERAKRSPAATVVVLGAITAFAIAIILLIRSGSTVAPTNPSGVDGHSPSAAAVGEPSPSASPSLSPSTTPAVAAPSPTDAANAAGSSDPAPDSSAAASASGEPAASSAPASDRPSTKTSKTKPGGTSSPVATSTAAPGQTNKVPDKMLDRFD
jgi:eukaryotic-like serine/threonine-protein kinase